MMRVEWPRRMVRPDEAKGGDMTTPKTPTPPYVPALLVAYDRSLRDVWPYNLRHIEAPHDTEREEYRIPFEVIHADGSREMHSAPVELIHADDCPFLHGRGPCTCKWELRIVEVLHDAGCDFMNGRGPCNCEWKVRAWKPTSGPDKFRHWYEESEDEQ